MVVGEEKNKSGLLEEGKGGLSFPAQGTNRFSSFRKREGKRCACRLEGKKRRRSRIHCGKRKKNLLLTFSRMVRHQHLNQGRGGRKDGGLSRRKKKGSRVVAPAGKENGGLFLCKKRLTLKHDIAGFREKKGGELQVQVSPEGRKNKQRRRRKKGGRTGPSATEKRKTPRSAAWCRREGEGGPMATSHKKGRGFQGGVC